MDKSGVLAKDVIIVGNDGKFIPSKAKTVVFTDTEGVEVKRITMIRKVRTHRKIFNRR